MQPISKMKRHEVELELVNKHGWPPTAASTWNLAELKLALRTVRSDKRMARLGHPE